MRAQNDEPNIDRWEFKFRILRVFQRTHGHCDVPLQTHQDSLHDWLEQQRADYRQGTLSPERAERLRQLGVSFEGETAPLSQRQQNELRWQQRYAELLAFKGRFGHCRVPARWRENMPLGRWLHIQRAWKRQGILSAQRIEQLEKVGVVWTAHGLTPADPSELHYKSNDLLWKTRFKQLQAWKDKDFRIPKGGPDEPVRRWMIKQRAAYRADRLTPERRRRLQEAGLLESTGQYDALWEKRFQQLLAYRARFGHCNVPARWIEDMPLGRWVHVQRAFKRQGTLSAERIRRLEEHGFLWMRDDFKPIRSSGEHYKVVDELWEARFRELKRWQKQNFKLPKNKQWLNKWMIRQRVAYHAGTLLPERQRRLGEIGFPWKAPPPYTALWEQRFAELLMYKQRFGHCNVPARWKENFPLGRWVSVQRPFRRRGWLNEERIRRLDEIGFEWDRSKAPRATTGAASS